MFQSLYHKVIRWASHQHAPYYLAGVSVAESSVFPIPPDVMLIPMVLGKPPNAWRYAFITTIASVFGGILGYLIGYLAFESFGLPLIHKFGYEAYFQTVAYWFEHYGWFAVLLAGITPIPYKLFTIAAGAAGMPILPFVLASIVGRAFRFFLVAGLTKTLGKSIETKLLKYFNVIGWGGLALIGLIVLGYYLVKT